ncbi:MAG: hypothetical protein H6559_05655 [Lewinellaceae bacterium]|nr:hypothetical protein [Lewinellaceae bacterium]
MKDIRNELIKALEQEIIGPAPNPEYIDALTGEELLLSRVHGSPQSRYGAAILYPQQFPAEHQPDGDSDKSTNSTEEDIPKTEREHETRGLVEEGNFDEEPVGLANQFKPSAMGFTIRFYSDVKNNEITLSFKSACYEKAQGQQVVKRKNKENEIEHVTFNGQIFLSDYWIRKPLNVESITFKLNRLFSNNAKSHEKILIQKGKEPWLKLSIFDRTTKQDKEEGFITLTFTLINALAATTDFRVNTANVLFQNELKLTTANPDLIAPYREKVSSVDTAEEKELNLLYRKKRIYAIGHGAAVVWTNDNGKIEKITEIKTAILPVYEMPQIAPTSHVELSMYELSDEGNWDIAKESLKRLERGYENWVEGIAELSQNSTELKNYGEAARINVEKCRNSLNRIKKGIQTLIKEEENSDTVNSFRWMNRAMIWQQQRSKTPIRKWIRTGKKDNYQFKLAGIGEDQRQSFLSLEEYHDSDKSKGRWRPFQLAFILMNIESIIDPSSNERDIIDLIWFPTGGGKTEAYLGLTAFTIFFRRLQGKDKWNWNEFGGTTAIMRYTLRLLTTQQYERAASLICGCDLIRRKNEKFLGTEPISIGLWVGGASTPNKHDEAVAQLNRLKKQNNADYSFIVMKCPCCAAQIGKLKQPIENQKIKGLSKKDGQDGMVVFKCENLNCDFSNEPLPLHVVDDYIYENPPTLLLGTVDKFSMITWNKEAGKLFGFREKNGEWTRIKPPTLIIQDELHLISGPLGTMVGLYETMVQALCNNYSLSKPPFISHEALEDYISPKIIASSATISRAFEQVQSLYAITDKSKLNIFPAQGLSFGDTWFSEEKTISDDYPGRKYVGILAPGYPSMQTAIVRAYAAVLQKVGELKPEKHIDYYWTLLGYFNSIRELGGASSLVFSDIRERLSQIHQRELIVSDQKRFIRRSEELTSRISSSEIPDILKKLEENFNQEKGQVLDICLATNMVATGVDVSRLGLMFIHGQPKTTAEYIQASSRVGRDVPNGPGLIITLYSPSKPRDKSQYEQFYSYHSRIYSNVEPTSVTPFSISSRQRALHAVLIGLVRHFSSGPMRSSAIIDEMEFNHLVETIKKIVLTRCETIDPDELIFTQDLLERRIKFWKNGFQNYGDPGNFMILQNEGYFPLMYSSGAEVRENVKDRSLPTPTSMRGVDTESQINIMTNP